MVAQELPEESEEKSPGSSSTLLENAESDGESKNLNGNDAGVHEESHLEETLNVEDVTCGLPFWKPKWLQCLASKKSYVIVYGLLGMSQSAIGSYFIGTISTIEKRFKLPSTTTGIISSTWDIGAMCAAMIMAYFGSSGHKTRWVAMGAVLAGFSCYMRYVPQALYGPGEYSLPTYGNNSSNSTGNMCKDENVVPENCSLNSEGLFTVIILTMAHFALGIGTSSYYTLGAAYMDDNSLKNKFPVLLAFSTCLRYIGPTMGFLTASYTLRFFVDLDATPPYGQNDPRWVGAWFMGWIPLGSWHLILACLMALFPTILPREAERRIKSGTPIKQAKKNKSLTDFKATLLRLIRNPILMLNTTSSTFYIFGMMGYFIFMPKYIETQFRQTASSASLITGTVGLICTALGVMTSGAIVSKFKPRPRYLAAWNVFTETIDIVGHAAFAFLGCYKDDLAGSSMSDGKWNLIENCNADCGCTGRLSYSPVCSSDLLTTYYSPCHAGCSEMSLINGTKTYLNCSCIDSGIATAGACPVDCANHFFIFLFLLCFMKFLSATGRAGNMIIQLRSVAPEDKSISMALAEVVVCALAFIPAPIVYGMLLDSSCLVWGETCGETGNCWLYHGQVLRYLLNFTASGFLAMATVMDIGVFFKVGSLKIYDEDVAKSKDGNDENESNTEKLLNNDENKK